MSKDAHSPHAKWLCSCHDEQLRPTGLPDAPETWVAHAMVGSFGFELLAGLPKETEYDYCVWKGVSPELHPYGACYHDIAEKLSTGLIEWLHYRKADTLIVGGLATDYCVKATVLQLCRAEPQWRVIVNRAACRGIAPETIEQAWQEMAQAGAVLLDSAADIARYLRENPHG